MARGEPRQGAMLLGGDASWQVPRVAGDTLHRGGGGGTMLRVDRQYAQAAPRREAGATTLASPPQESLDGAEHGEMPKPRGARADDGGGPTGACGGNPSKGIGIRGTLCHSPHGAVTNLEGDVHVASLALDVVGIERLGIAPFEDAALAARLTIVQAPPSIDDIGLALFAGGGVYLGWLHWTSD